MPAEASVARRGRDGCCAFSRVLSTPVPQPLSKAWLVAVMGQRVVRRWMRVWQGGGGEAFDVGVVGGHGGPVFGVGV